jgi:hypothetical protein
MFLIFLAAGFFLNWGLFSGVIKGSLVVKIFLWIATFVLGAAFSKDFNEFLAIVVSTLAAAAIGLVSRWIFN